MKDNVFTFPWRESAEPGRTLKYNLPVQLTSLIGREQEVAAACVLLRRSDVRLLTLTGTGGIGKTSLALRVATDLLNDFPDGVCLVLLAPISDPDLVVSTIAQTLGIKEVGARPLLDLLKAHLQDKHLLLFLDNFEQVVIAAPVLTELLETCLSLKLLVTSREVLRLRGEQEFSVPPLALPDLACLPPSESLSQYAAVALFIQRAQAVKPDFHLTDANASGIAAICARLDGLPLALELAAARLKHLPVQALLARLEHRLLLLTQGPRDVHARQQTLRNTIRWSYDLLRVHEQRLFRRLSVFVGGCTLEAIEALYMVPGGETSKVFDGVTSLIDKSLLQRSEQEGGGGEEPRFMMLETIREYGLERLARGKEIEATRNAHMAYYLQLAEEAAQHWLGPEQSAWFDLLEWEQESLALFRQVGDTAGVGRAVFHLGIIAYTRGNFAAARSRFEESLALHKEVGDKEYTGVALSFLACSYIYQGEYILGRSLAEASLALCRELNGGEGEVLGDLGEVYLSITQRGMQDKGGPSYPPRSLCPRLWPTIGAHTERCYPRRCCPRPRCQPSLHLVP